MSVHHFRFLGNCRVYQESVSACSDCLLNMHLLNLRQVDVEVHPEIIKSNQKPDTRHRRPHTAQNKRKMRNITEQENEKDVNKIMENLKKGE